MRPILLSFASFDPLTVDACADPETKGKSLEDIDLLFSDGHFSTIHEAKGAVVELDGAGSKREGSGISSEEKVNEGA